MALSFEEQRLFDFARGSLPSWVNDADEFLFGCAKMFGAVRAMFDYWFAQTLIGGATGATADTPDWLAQHARDRASGRTGTELDPAMRNRLRNVPDALTRESIITAAEAILEAAGTPGTVHMLELPRDAAHFGTWAAMSGMGGEFSDPDTAGVQQFTPTDGWATPPVDSTGTGQPWDPWRLTTTGAAEGTNDFVTDVDGTGADVPGDIIGNAVQYSNPTGVASVDSGVTWTAERYVHPPWIATGQHRAFLGRGYRMARTRPMTIVLILPYGTTAGTESAVGEMLRQKRAAGMVQRIERRQVPP